MKLEDKNVVQGAFHQVAINLHNINPVCDIMESGDHREIVLSEKDLETIRQLKETPPQPTPELIAGFKEIMKQRV